MGIQILNSVREEVEGSNRMDSCRKEIVDGGVVNHAREREYEKDEGVLWGGGRERF